MSDNDATLGKWLRLREPFKSEEIGKKPGWNTSQRAKQAPWLDRCPDCGRGHRKADFHLDYVGHPHVTDRLQEVDPEWTWEPLAYDDHGLPLRDSSGGLWVRLTVLGVSRIEYGLGRDVKAAISDALKRAAMRFGVALDLWVRETGEESPTAVESEGVEQTYPDGFADDEEYERWRVAYATAGEELDDVRRQTVKLYQDRVGYRWPFTKQQFRNMLAAIEVVLDESDAHAAISDDEVSTWLATYGDTLPDGPDAEPGGG